MATSSETQTTVINADDLTGNPAVRVAANTRFVNLAASFLTLETAHPSDPLAAALVIDGSGVTIENEERGHIIAVDLESPQYTAILGSPFADTVINRGGIWGTVLLGEGDDKFTQHLATAAFGSATMILDLGAGDDQIVFDTTGFTDFFRMDVRGGAGFDRVTITGVSEINFAKNIFTGVERLDLTGTGAASVAYARNFTVPEIHLSPGLTFRLDSVYGPGSAADVIYLNGGSLKIGFNVALGRVQGSDAAEIVELEISPDEQLVAQSSTVESVHLGGGDDRFFVWFPQELNLTVLGEEGADHISGAPLADFLSGGPGDDVIVGKAGDDELHGGEGDDNLQGGDGDDVLHVLGGSDVADGGAGTDTLVIDYSDGTTTLSTTVGPNANASLGGFDGQFHDSHSDVTYSSIERFVITTGSASDSVTTGSGDDVISTGAGDDWVMAGAGDDLVDVGTGIDRAHGGDGIDGLVADLSAEMWQVAVSLNPSISFGSSIYRFDFRDFEFFTRFETGSGGDFVVTGAIAANDTVVTNAGADIIYVYDGHDVVAAGDGVDSLVIDFRDHDRAIVTNAGPEAGASGFSGEYSDLAGRSVAYSGVEEFSISGGSGNDNLVTASGDDVARGGSGDDTIRAGAGDDFLSGGAGDDLLDGGDGVDLVSYSSALDVFTSGVTVSLAFSGPQDTGGAGVDTLIGIEYLVGSRFDDVLTGNDEANTISGGAGNDVIDGRGGIDTLSYALVGPFDPSTEGVRVSLAVSGPQDTGTAGIDTIVNFENLAGSWGDDHLTGDSGDNRIEGLSGSDVIDVSAGGFDVADGDDSWDRLIVDWSTASAAITSVPGSSFASGTDRRVDYSGIEEIHITGGSGDDVIETGGGDDMIDGGAGADLMRGGAGHDIYIVDDLGDVIENEDFIHGVDEVRTSLADYVLPENIERLTYTGSGGSSLRGNVGDNEMEGGGGADFFDLRDGGDDNASGGAGNDGFYFGGAFTGGDGVDGGDGADQLGLQGDYSLVLGNYDLEEIETLALLSGTDTRFGTSGADRFSYAITTADGNVAAAAVLKVNFNTLVVGENVTFDGSAEQDGGFFLFAGKGVDDLTGGAQGDAFYFGPDGAFTTADRVDGGGGTDQVALRGNYSVALTGDELANVETLALLSGKDTRFGAAGPDNDYVVAFADGNVAAGTQFVVNAQTLRAGESVVFDGSAESDGSFRFVGGAGDDTFTGSANADTIFGAGGADTLTGGAGADLFRYRSASESTLGAADTITDFVSGSDRIDLSLIDADTGAAGDQAFAFIGDAAFSGAAGELRVVQSAGGWTIEGDVDGDSAADLVIALTSPPPVAGDFVL